MSQMIRYDFCIAPDEQLDVVIKLAKEARGVIHDVVLDDCGKPVKDAVVKLFEVDCDKHDCDKCDKDEKKSCKLIPLTHAFTDDCGQFLFGPLCAHRHYAVKIWVNDVCQEEQFVQASFQGECLKFHACDDDCVCKDHMDKDCMCKDDEKKEDLPRDRKDNCGCRDERKYR